MLKDYIKLLRPHQYLKNLLIFFPLIFAVKVTHVDLLLNALIAFIAFSLTASSIYIFNDIKDVEEDKVHPSKKNRPIAAGKIPVKNALIVMIILLCFGLGIATSLNITFLYILLGYFGMNILYSLKLKHIAIIDIIIISIGFVLRIFSGSVVVGVITTEWIIIMTFLLSMFLALAKRRDDVLLSTDSENKTRKNIDGYNLVFIDSSMMIMASIVIVAYILYTISPETATKFHSKYLYLTTLFVIAGIIRYMQITFVENKSGSPTNVLIKDKFLQVCILLWLSLFIALIY